MFIKHEQKLAHDEAGSYYANVTHVFDNGKYSHLQGQYTLEGAKQRLKQLRDRLEVMKE